MEKKQSDSAMKEKAIIFDFFGVVSARVSIVWLGNNFPEDQKDKIHKTYVYDVYAGKISEDEFFKEMARLVNRPPELIKQEWVELSKINTEIVELIKELKPHYYIGLCSDAFIPFTRELLDKSGITNLFDDIVMSAEVKLKKPSKEIFELILNRLNVKPENSVFIDDQQINVSGAETTGMKGILYSNVDQLRSDLKKLISLSNLA